MIHGLSAFPLTPMTESSIDLRAFAGLVERIAAAGVDSMGVLGSTGSYAYLAKTERMRVLREALAHAGAVPVIAGIGALRNRDVLALAKDAEDVGAAGLLLAPVSYQPLTEHEVYTLFESACTAVRTPICVYDNPPPPGSSSAMNCMDASPPCPTSHRSRFRGCPAIPSKRQGASAHCAPIFRHTSRWASAATRRPCMAWPPAAMAGTR